jgi:Protein of unknown function (DUF4058)
MPLRDHFRPPVTDIASWEELHGLWPGIIAVRLNSLLPPNYRSGVKIHLGSAVEIDVAAFELQNVGGHGNHDPFDSALEWKAATPVVLLDTDELTPPEYEVRVYDQRHTRRLVAAVEIVSPRNKDRAEARGAFVSKCHAFLQQEVCVVIVDPVTERTANLYAELAERIRARPPATADRPIYAVSCRARSAHGRHQVEAWEHGLEVGTPLPTLPLWISESQYVPLELERTYEDTCKGLRIP